jgi:histidinol-phosphate aminotransferase
MALSRREFVRTLGGGGAAAIVSGDIISARGREAHGDRWMRAAVETGQSAIRIDSNENPNGPGPAAIDAIKSAVSIANRYPFTEENQIVETIAAAQRVKPENVLVACGSTEVLRMAVLAFTSPSRPLVTAAPTFEDPAELARAMNVPVKAVRVDEALKLDLRAMEGSAGGAGLVYICNPNNPTATVHGASAIAEFVARVTKASPTTMILVDEAYFEYVDDPSYASAIPLTLERRNVIVSRTFSKVYGMAGLRCGYAVGQTSTLQRLLPFKLATAVNQLVIAAALASLGQTEHIESERRLNRDAKDYTRRLFESMGFAVTPSETNFLMVDIRRDARRFQDSCRSGGVLVGRPFPPLTTHARISIGTMEEMRQAGDVFRRVLAG